MHSRTDLTEGITVVVPTHPARVRNGMTKRAVGSVLGQTLPAAAVIVEQDLTGEGAPATRHRGLMKVTTEWTAFLDSDDQFKPQHLEALHACAMDTGADYVYSHYLVVGGTDPRPWSLGKPFDPAAPHQTTTVILVRTGLAQDLGIRTIGDLRAPDRLYAGEDWDFTLRCVEAGAKIVHHPEVTWLWHHHGENSSGLPHRGDAA